MAAAGCRQVSLGFESGCESMLKILNKRFSLEDVRAIATRFAIHGIERMGFLLLGGPGETVTSAERSLAFADSLNLETLRLTAGIRIYPGTQLAKIAASEGYSFLPDNLLHPHFYLAHELAGWLLPRLKEWQASHTNVIM